MSASSSDSEGKDWTIVNDDGDIDTSDDGSSQSSGFVKIEDGACSYHLKSGQPPQPGCSQDDAPSSPSAAVSLNEWSNDWFWDDHDLCLSEDESQSAADEEKAATATMTFEPPHDDLEHCDLEHSPDLSSGETSEGSMEVLNHSETEDMMQVPPEQTTELEKQNDQPSKSDLESDQPSQSDKQDVNATGNIETSGTDKLDDDRETEAGDDKLEQREKQSESGNEREADSEHESEEEAGPSGIQAYCGLPSNASVGELQDTVIEKMKNYFKQCSESSDSDSDFVRLDGSMVEDMLGAVGGVGAPGGAQGGVPGGDMSASSSSQSSISSNFQFIQQLFHPALQPFRNHGDQDNDDEDNDTIPEDVDDRCESDISGVAGDTSDLSSMVYQIGDAPLTAEDVPRSYCHQPNERLDAVLTTIALLALFMAAGIGVGHYIGTTREASIRKQYIVRMKELQDDYLMCLRDQSILQNNIKKQPPMEEKFGFLMAAWQDKYQELLVEKANLEVKVADLERHLVNTQVQTKTFMAADLLPKTLDEGESVSREDEDTRDIIELEGHIAAVETLEQELKQSLHDSEMRLQEYVKLQAQATETIQALNTRLYQVDVERQELSQDVGELQAQHKQLQLYNTQLKTDLSQLETKTSHLQNILQQLEKDKLQLQIIIDQLNNNNSQLENDKAQLEIDKLQLENGNSQLENDKAQLEREKAALVEQLKIQEEQLLQLQTQLEVQKTPNSPEGESPATHEPHTTVDSLRDELNQLTHEKNELMGELMRLRYSEHPGNAMATVDQDVKVQINQLLTENNDLRTVVGKLRYSPPAIGDASYEEEADAQVDTLKQKLRETRHLLEKEQDISHLWQTLYVAEKVTNDNQAVTNSFMTCLSLLLPQITPESHGGVNATLQLHWQFLLNVTQDSAFLQHLEDHWKDLQLYVAQDSHNLSSIPDEALAIYGHLQQTLLLRWLDFQTNLSQSASPNTTEPFKRTVEVAQQTVRQLSDTLQHTWEKVRSLSSEFLQRHEQTITRVKDKVKNKVSHIGLKVQNKLEGVKKKLQAYGIFDKQNKKKSKNKKKEKTEKSEELHYETSEGKRFEDKPSHKQKQSDHEAYRQYEEYWRQSGFDPDDVLEEGFFQSNNREWRKHQKTLRKLHGRIHKLNEDMINSMDDDDVEDIYDDLEDLQDDLDDFEQPEKLKTWLTCQIRWWKSRFQRKKRDEDLVQGCGKQLMHWQLRVICKELCSNNHCKKKVKVICSVILHPQSFHSEHSETVANAHKAKLDVEVESINVKNTDNVEAVDNNANHVDENSWNANLPLDSNSTQSEGINWYLGRMYARDDMKGSAKWYQARMEDREDRRHDPLWYVRAMEQHSQGSYPHSDPHNPHPDPHHPKDQRNKRHFRGHHFEEHIREKWSSNGRHKVNHRYRYKKHNTHRRPYTGDFCF